VGWDGGLTWGFSKFLGAKSETDVPSHRFRGCDSCGRLDRDAIPCAVPAHLQDPCLDQTPRPSPAMHDYRTHTCGELRKHDVGKIVRLSGWAHRVPDHGGR